MASTKSKQDALIDELLKECQDPKLDAAVLFQAVGHGEVCEIQIAGGLSESHAIFLTRSNLDEQNIEYNRLITNRLRIVISI
jgi:hypothetical protein